MAEYVERMEELMLAMNAGARAIKNAISMIQALPAVDVELVRHGTWRRGRNNWYCSNCGKGYRICNGATSANSFMFCPNCGAKMDGGAE